MKIIIHDNQLCNQTKRKAKFLYIHNEKITVKIRRIIW
jgi:hypothetical protein